jgi:4-hydroxythreonine-4-phosphate dehydrogenase
LTAALPAILVSSGEPAGIGPDIALALAAIEIPARVGVLGDRALLEARAGLLGLAVQLPRRASPADLEPHRRGVVQLLEIEAAVAAEPGRLDPRNSAYVLELIRRGAQLCATGTADALVTAPVQKSVITQSGVPFRGHTEYLAELTGAPLPVMLLVREGLRVALATTHLPLRDVPDALSTTQLRRLLAVLAGDLKKRFRIPEPRILVLGLNPHAGESGTLGDEEIAIIGPALEAARAEGIDALGPVPADTAFTPESLRRCDAVLAMYHDQGLPVIKALGFGATVNVTCGLPIVRTSVDHGTALELAGTGRARAGSLVAAVQLAIELAAGARV